MRRRRRRKRRGQQQQPALAHDLHASAWNFVQVHTADLLSCESCEKRIW